jgi:hypothetical protein
MNTFTKRELATVLAALRCWQETQQDQPQSGMLDQIATEGGSLAALDKDEIDMLCARINSTESIAVIFHKHMSGHSYTVARLVECPDSIIRAVEFKDPTYSYSPLRFTRKDAAFAFAKAEAAKFGANVPPELMVESVGLGAAAIIPLSARQALERKYATAGQREA